MSNPSEIDVPPFQDPLEDWASLFSSSPEIQRKLIDLTISKTIDAVQEIIDADDVERPLFTIMRSIALEEFGLDVGNHHNRDRNGHERRNHSRCRAGAS